MSTFKFTASISIILISLSFVAHSDNNEIKFPANYSSTFTNYVSNDRIQNPDQTIRLFANDIAIMGPDEEGKLHYGSIIVAEIYKAKKDENGDVAKSILNRRIRGELALIAVMQREKGFSDDLPKELKNDDWDFAAFKPDGSIADKDLNECRACHAPLTTTNHLFSYQHLMK